MGYPSHVWSTPFAIDPVAQHARLSRELVMAVERSLSTASGELDEGEILSTLARLKQRQPVLSERLERLLRGSRDEAAVALGYFLLLCVFASFERAFGARLELVSKANYEATLAKLKLEAELRAERSFEPLEVEDLLTLQQPGLFSWVAEHAESTLAASVESGHEVDVNDVDAVLAEVSACILALSYAVCPPSGEHHRIALA